MWGFGIPTQALWDSFEPGDPRRDASMVREGGIDTMQTSKGKWVPYSFEHCITKIYSTKWEASSAEFKDKGGPWHSAPQNVDLSVSEFALMLQTALMLGDAGKALTYVNKVHEPENCGSRIPAPFASLLWPTSSKNVVLNLPAKANVMPTLFAGGAADLLNAHHNRRLCPRSLLANMIPPLLPVK